MEFENNNILHQLERPPSKDNLSIYNVIQLILMLFIGISAANKLNYLLSQNYISLSNLIEIIVDILLIIGIIIIIFGFIRDNINFKYGFLLFYFGCILLLIKKIIDLFENELFIFSLLELMIVILIIFVSVYITKP